MYSSVYFSPSLWLEMTTPQRHRWFVKTQSLLPGGVGLPRLPNCTRLTDAIFIFSLVTMTATEKPSMEVRKKIFIKRNKKEEASKRKCPWAKLESRPLNSRFCLFFESLCRRIQRRRKKERGGCYDINGQGTQRHPRRSAYEKPSGTDFWNAGSMETEPRYNRQTKTPTP